MNTQLFDILADHEALKIKKLDIRNVKIGDLTVNELQILYLALFDVPNFRNINYPASFTLEMLLRRITLKQAIA